jgi:formiminotetrahydrofolate cyclodeaminase
MKQLILELDDKTYDSLHELAGKDRVEDFLKIMLIPYLPESELEAGYRQKALEEAAYAAMAQDKERESEALEWAEATIGDVAK